MKQQNFVKDILDRMPKLKALVIGDIMLDHYVWGDATRISPEAPVPVVSISRDTYALGGAANVAANIRAFGAQAELWGWLGDDEAGRRMLSMLKQSGVTFRRDKFVLKNSPTIQKTRVLVRHQQLCRLDREPHPADYKTGFNPLSESMIGGVSKYDAIILSDYAKGFLNDRLVEQVIKTAQAAGKIIALDPKPPRSLKCHDLDLVTPNRREALLMAGLSGTEQEHFPAETVCRAIWKRYRPRHLVVTMGEEGMLLSSKGRITKKMPTVAREVYDVSGAGDTTIAAISMALAGGASLVEAAHFANTAAGVVVGKVGTAVALPREILACRQ